MEKYFGPMEENIDNRHDNVTMHISFAVHEHEKRLAIVVVREQIRVELRIRTKQAVRGQTACPEIYLGRSLSTSPTSPFSFPLSSLRASRQILTLTNPVNIKEPSVNRNALPISMTRYFKFALCVIFALVALVTVARAEEEKFFDENGNRIKFINSGGDPDWHEETEHKRSIHIRGKSSFGMNKRDVALARIHSFTHGPDYLEKIWKQGVKITWYASHDLKDPACGSGHWNPKNHHHIGAVMKGWENGPSCGDFVRLCNEKTQRCTKVRIVDHCEGCSADHIDLTKSAFKRLATTGTLDEGVTTGLSMWTSRTPNPWDLALFGPFKLKI